MPIPPAASTADPTAPPELAAAVARVRAGERWEQVLSWVERLTAQEHRRLLGDLDLLLGEPAETGESLDWRELRETLEEYRGLAGGGAPLVRVPVPVGSGLYAVSLRPRDRRTLERASPAVREAAAEALLRFLPHQPTHAAALTRGRLRKMPDRDLWQLQLPDGYRLRYHVAEPERTVYVVYVGPHPDGLEAGREAAVRARVRRGRHERGLVPPR